MKTRSLSNLNHRLHQIHSGQVDSYIFPVTQEVPISGLTQSTHYPHFFSAPLYKCWDNTLKHGHTDFPHYLFHLVLWHLPVLFNAEYPKQDISNRRLHQPTIFSVFQFAGLTANPTVLENMHDLILNF